MESNFLNFQPCYSRQEKRKKVYDSSEKNNYLCICLYSNRDVAQLVAHYVRDVGVASSTLVIPTEKGKKPLGFFPFWFYWAN